MMNAINNGTKYNCSSVACHRPYKLSGCRQLFMCWQLQFLRARRCYDTAAADSAGHRWRENTGQACQIQVRQ